MQIGHASPCFLLLFQQLHGSTFLAQNDVAGASAGPIRMYALESKVKLADKPLWGLQTAEAGQCCLALKSLDDPFHHPGEFGSTSIASCFHLQ